MTQIVSKFALVSLCNSNIDESMSEFLVDFASHCSIRIAEITNATTTTNDKKEQNANC